MTARNRSGREEKKPRRRGVLGVTRTWLVAVAVLAAATGAALLFGAPNSSGTIQAKQREIASEQPEIILLGNSMLGEGIDEGLFEKLTGLSTYKWASGGSETAYWYVAVKNVIATCSYRPECLLLFFRDAFLTDPTNRVAGKYRDLIEQWTLAEEPLLDRLAYQSETGSRWARALEKAWPLYGSRRRLRNKAEGYLKAAMEAMLGVPSGQIARAADTALGDSKLDPERLNELQGAAEETSVPVFSEVVDRSLLPEIIRVTEDAGIQLILVRVKRRSDAMGIPQEPEMVEYIDALKAYLAERRIRILDFSDDLRIGIDLFAAGDHLDRGNGRPVFTRILAEALAAARSSPE